MYIPLSSNTFKSSFNTFFYKCCSPFDTFCCFDVVQLKEKLQPYLNVFLLTVKCDKKALQWSPDRN